MEKANRLHRIFEISVLLKGLHAALELLSGLLLLFVSPGTIVDLIAYLTQNELAEDPHDLVAHYLYQIGQHLSLSTKTFGALYLLSHGVVHLVLVVGLLANKLWAYPASLIVLSAFIGYQVYRFTHTHAIGLILLTLFDLFVVWLVWREYRVVRRLQAVR